MTATIDSIGAVVCCDGRGTYRSEASGAHFGTQRPKDWFDEETFRGLARLRGMECRAPERFAEAFFARKLTLD